MKNPDAASMFTAESKASNDGLGAMREQYQWSTSALAPIPMYLNKLLGDTPEGGASFIAEAEQSDTPSIFGRALLTLEQHAALEMIVATNKTEEDVLAAVEKHEAFGVKADDPSDFDKGTGVPKTDVPSFWSYLIQRATFQKLNTILYNHLVSSNPPVNTPEDYYNIYQSFLSDLLLFGGKSNKILGPDDLHLNFEEEHIFGWQRLAGTNPRTLTALTSANLDAFKAKMLLTDSHVQALAGATTTIQSEIDAGKLFYCDYWLLKGIPCQPGRSMTPVIGVFWSDVVNSWLLPVAIQLGQAPSDPIMTPSTSTASDWSIAKRQFQVADFNYHEMGVHLSAAHFTQEAFLVAARRTLPTDHPIGSLLFQIYYALLFNNTLGRQDLIQPQGPTQQMMAGLLQSGSLQIVKNYYSQVWNWDEWNFPLFIRNQGTTKSTGLPVYPYRDDGMLLWNAINGFATDYVNAHYGSDNAVATDGYLQSWVAELLDSKMGNLRDKGFPPAVQTMVVLIDVLTRLIWQAGPGHGGINYSQYQYFAFVPNDPGAAYGPLGEATSLPAVSQTLAQVNILNVITQKLFGRLGSYDSSFVTSINSGPINNFVQALGKVAAQIDTWNGEEPRKSLQYPFMHPSNLPNSTNI